MDTEKLLSISQLAKLRNLTSETLRHYDRIGLIKPVYVDPNTNYRYYSIRQYEKLGTVKELRQLGLALDVIVEYFTDRNVVKSKKILQSHSKKLRCEIEEKVATYKVLMHKLRFIEGLQQLPAMNTVIERDLPERYMLTFGKAAGGPKEHALIITKLEGHLNEIAPILASDRVGVYATEDFLNVSRDYVPAIPMILIEAECPDSALCKTIPAGHYLSLFYHSGNLERYDQSFEIVKEYMRCHNLKVAGLIFQIYKLDVTLTSDPEETIIEIQIPVRQ